MSIRYPGSPRDAAAGYDQKPRTPVGLEVLCLMINSLSCNVSSFRVFGIYNPVVESSLRCGHPIQASAGHLSLLARRLSQVTSWILFRRGWRDSEPDRPCALSPFLRSASAVVPGGQQRGLHRLGCAMARVCARRPLIAYVWLTYLCAGTAHHGYGVIVRIGARCVAVRERTQAAVCCCLNRTFHSPGFM